MKISLVQKRHTLGNKEENKSIIVEHLKDSESDLLVFPELFLTGYSLHDRLWEEAEKIPGPSTREIAEVADENDTSVIFGMPEKVDRKGRLYNCSVLIRPNGDIERYRKTYLPNFGPFEEKLFFDHDDHLPVFDLNGIKLGLTICYDLFFPEITKGHALKNADLLVCISASPSISREFFEKTVPARAIETASYVLYSNLLGREDNLAFWGGAEIVSPKGERMEKAEYYEEDIITQDIDFDDLENYRRGRPVLSDTREEVIEELSRSISNKSEQ